MTSSLPRPSRGLPDIFQLFETEWPFAVRHAMRVETFTEQNDFVLRCELPGVDPDNDIHVDVEGDQLTVNAERRSEERAGRRSEFHYGAMSRSLLLPTDCDTDNISAEYDAGILTVRIPRRAKESRHEVPVARKGT
ncbi:Hsp20/alpha crystallin family protein [Saccharopolyspora rosea]|uniref:Hsp20/alpha crystallin family protein n=1 Tax=Saccharopolyspora rosea TaxID=524884 RepID=UPI0021D9F7F0|nr:Hsp20/alpha crystallin family protein [Saccharopolyspora rosea]